MQQNVIYLTILKDIFLPSLDTSRNFAKASEDFVVPFPPLGSEKVQVLRQCQLHCRGRVAEALAEALATDYYCREGLDPHPTGPLQRGIRSQTNEKATVYGMKSPLKRDKGGCKIKLHLSGATCDGVTQGAPIFKVQ